MVVVDRDQFLALLYTPGTSQDLRSAPRHTVFSHLLTDDDSDGEKDKKKNDLQPRLPPTIGDPDGDETMSTDPGAAAPFNFNTSSLADSSSAGTPATGSAAHHHHQSHRDASPHDDDDGEGIPPNATVYQTTGPNAYTRPIEAPDGSGPAFNPRSCVTCRRRKVKCDKQMPCTTCRKALIPCIFPAPGRKPRQSRPRDPNAPPKSFSKREVELVKRLKKLEGIVEELSGQIEVDSKGNSPDASFSPTGVRSGLRQSSGALGDTSMSPSGRSPKDTDSISDASEAARRSQLQTKFGKLVLNDHKGRTKYVSSAFWSKMSDEIAALRRDTQAMTDNEEEASDSDESNDESPLDHKVAHNHHSFLLGYSSADVDLRKLYPAPSHIWFLWKIYQDVVEPLIKVIHVPTTDQLLRDATKNLDDLSAGKQALVFCIIFAAVVALEPDDAERNFNTAKANLVAQYRFAAEMALAKADILTTTDFTVIQALTIFLICVKTFDTSRFCWSMTGLVIRLAMGMGLHRDGAHFDLTPFEIELRRRVWWAIIKLDLRSSEELGTDLTIDNRGFDTEMPTNVDDKDIGPDSTEIVAKEGRSDMSVQLLRCEVTNMARRILTATSAAGTLCPVDGQNGFQDMEKLLLDFYHTRVEKQIAQHSVDGKGYHDPVFWVATVIARLVMSKLYLLIYQPELFNDSGALSVEVRQRIYTSAIEILECDNKLNTDSRAYPYRWLYLTYASWQAVSYSLVTSARCAWTPLSERCWEAICSFKRVPVETSKRANHSAVFLPLRRLFLNVRKHRAAEIARLKAHPEEAKRLDDQERMNMNGHWMQPTAGDQERMEDVRAKWWALIGSNLGSAGEGTQQANSVQNARALHQQQQQQQDVGAGSASPGDASMQMQYLSQMMSQPDLTMAELFSLQNQPGHLNQFAQPLGPQMAMPQDPSSFTTTPLYANNEPQPLNPIIQQGEENLPPFMYNTWFGNPVSGNANDVMGMGVNGGKELGDKNLRATNVMAGGTDVDMLNGEFDWQDWTEVMNGIDMWQGGEAPGARV